MSIRYIGSKARVADRIIDIAGDPSASSTWVDAMTGSGSVARAAAERGWRLRINDHLVSSVTLAAARVTSGWQAPLTSWGGYHRALAALNGASARAGTIHREYSPASVAAVGHERRYFTEGNAARIDGIRAELDHWADQGLLWRAEQRVLLADLLVAANAVANTAGTYGCFLRHWSSNALRPLVLRPRALLTEPVQVEVMTLDVLDVPISREDVAYYDPPYTKRQYAAYYHILETIALGDDPAVSGITGLRPWAHLASDFCYRRRALGAILRLVESCAAQRVLLSYSDDGQVPRDALVDALNPMGALTVHELGSVGRYRPNVSARAARETVAELLLELRKSPQQAIGGSTARRPVGGEP